MDDWLLRLFSLEIQRQCKFAFNAYEDIQKVVEEINSLFTSGNTTRLAEEMPELGHRLWQNIQSFLIAESNISKVFSPDPRKQKYQQRGDELKKKFPLGTLFLTKSRELRNKFEHFDEYLEDYTITSSQPFIDSNIGPRAGISAGDPTKYFRNFNPSTGELTFLETTYKLNERYDTIKNLYDEVVNNSEIQL